MTGANRSSSHAQHTKSRTPLPTPALTTQATTRTRNDCAEPHAPSSSADAAVCRGGLERGWSIHPRPARHADAGRSATGPPAAARTCRASRGAGGHGRAAGVPRGRRGARRGLWGRQLQKFESCAVKPPKRAGAAADPLYFLAGRADSEDFARAEHLAETLMTAVPNVKCRVIPVLPEQWDKYSKKLCGRLGCALQHPLVWSATGKLVGNLTDFIELTELKYSVTLDPEVKDETWRKIAKANLAALRLKVSGARPDLAPTGSGGERGAAVGEGLMQGHKRYLEGKPGAPYNANGLCAAVLTLGKLPAPVYQMLDCPDTAVVVVPCGPMGVDSNAAKAAEALVFKGGCRSIFIIGNHTDELALSLQSTTAQLASIDAPLPAQERALVARMMPAIARMLAVAPPSCSEEDRLTLALEEWVREGQDDLFKESPALSELYMRQGLHVTRCAFHGGRLHEI
ncbi:hypothetical protein AB1Y20_016116 [Prymnesium parvum]|uniref:Uncharacterized protein n=1 Tax=Prymnesium parvum TaxID=97485 RepID=A0AB34JZQ1_PRYPA